MSIVAVHSVLVELHGGMLTLATGCILLTAIARVQLRNQKATSTWPTESFMGKLARYTEPTAYLAAIGGLIGLVLSAIIGLFIWPTDFLAASTIGMSKVMFSIFALDLFFVFVFVRSRYGEKLWKNGGTATVYALIGIIGFLLMVVAASFGGHMALTANGTPKGSILDPLYTLVGFNPETFGFVGSNFVIVTVVVTLVNLIVPTALFMYLQRRSLLKNSTKT